MRGHAFALVCVAPAALMVPDRAAAYAPHSVVVPTPAAATQHPRDPFSPVQDGKTSLPPVIGIDREADDARVPVDPHAEEPDATDVPVPARAGVEDISYDLSALPAPVAETRRRLLEAALTGDIEALRPVFDDQRGTVLTGWAGGADPVESLKLQSGDEEGREILAILLELLEAGYVHVGPPDGGTYVWPYFAEVPLEDLAPRHYVEVYRVLTAIDVEELLNLGRYTFFRVGIAHDGRLRYFSAGELE